MKDEIENDIVKDDQILDEAYWNNQYLTGSTGWDLGQVSPPLKSYFDTLENKNVSILIPGCGNSYEAEYLVANGFTNITLIDIAPLPVEKLRKKFVDNRNIKIVLGDFFAHQMTYDVIIEQTFFCALSPSLRFKYAQKMHQLLNKNGILVGLLFNRTFDKSPPFGGNREEYELLFKSAFNINKMEPCKNSFPARANTELWIELKKNAFSVINLYNFTGITCNGCKETVTNNFLGLEGVLNVHFNTDFSEVLIVSEKEIPLMLLQNQIVYDGKYSIRKIAV